MKTYVLFLGLMLTITSAAAEQIVVTANKADQGMILQWQGGAGPFEVQRSDNLRQWQPIGWPTSSRSVALPLSSAQNGLITSRAGTISGAPAPASPPTTITEIFRVNTRSPEDLVVSESAASMIIEGRETFRYDTFGDEAFWGDTLKLHRAIAGAANGGVGPGLSPKAALGLGLKVDARALPSNVVAAVQSGALNLDDPTNTLALLQLNAVVGVTGFFTNNTLSSVGIQCALCHSTVDDSFAPGIGARLDGWPNRDLNVGAIIALAPDKSFFTNHFGLPESAIVNILTNWGPGKFDAELILDGKGFRPDGKTAATLLPAAFGLAGINLHTYTGWGSVTYWNAFVAVLEMQGQGTFFDPRMNDPVKFPLAVKAGLFNVRRQPDLVTSKLPALHVYQLAIPAPKPPTNSFDAVAAGRGETVFTGQGRCATCHVPPLFGEPGWMMHTAEEVGVDDFQANRSPDERYRTTPLKGLFTRQKGGFFHDGRFATLVDVVNHYNSNRALGLSDQQKLDLVEYLKSL
jgi:hypothetical protein